MKVLFAAAEAAPIVKVGGLADVVGSLPGALAELGHDVRIVLPVYRTVDLMQLGAVGEFAFEFDFLGSSQRVTVFAAVLPGAQTPVYLLDNAEYFGGFDVYEDRGAGVGGAFEIEKFVFFSRAVAEFVQRSPWQPDVLHCHDWHAAGAVLALKFGRYVRKPRTVLTIHNLAMQGRAPSRVAAELGFDPLKVASTAADPSAAAGVNLLRQGIIHAGRVTTVSKTYAQEILTPEFGEGLDGMLAARGDVVGILNGIDTVTWNPERDRFVPTPFSVKDLSGKAAAKQELQKAAGLATDPRIPVAAIVSRLTEQKGFTLLPQVERELLGLNFQFVVLGVGDKPVEEFFERFRKERPSSCAVIEKFDESLAHKMYAGADIFLMPSRFEPCGLGQMIAMRYATLPLVHSVGGLADTVFDGSNGFAFSEFTGAALLGKLTEALKMFTDDPAAWKKMQLAAASQDFSWARSAREYAKIYGNL
jgi:starch synthase